MNPMLIYYLTLVSSILVSSLGIYFAIKNKHTIIKWILIINFILGVILNLDYGNVIPYIYFIFLIGRRIYHKFKQ